MNDNIYYYLLLIDRVPLRQLGEFERGPYMHKNMIKMMSLCVHPRAPDMVR